METKEQNGNGHVHWPTASEADALFGTEDAREHIVTVDDGTDELITFNVSGKIFMTLGSTLDTFPESMFGTKDKRDNLLRTRRGAIFLNKNPKVFKRVLTFFQTGIMEVPDKMNQIIFLNDVKYYGLEQEASECGITGFVPQVRTMPRSKWRAMLWNIVEYPDSCLAARLFSIASILIILVSIVAFCWETIPSYRDRHKNRPEHDHNTRDFSEPLDQIELFCILWFSLELTARFVLCPDKIRFIKSWLNIIDLVAILPFLVTSFGRFDSVVSIYFLRTIRLARVFRVFKLSRHSMEMKVLAIAVKNSARELGVLVFFILLGVLIFSSAVYYAEQSNPKSTIQSIPGAFWWSIVTMTTVGYGDVVPITIVGRLVGAMCGMAGILVIALPIPIIVNNFTRQYQRLKPASKYYEQIQTRNEQAAVVSGLYCETNI